MVVGMAVGTAAGMAVRDRMAVAAGMAARDHTAVVVGMAAGMVAKDHTAVAQSNFRSYHKILHPQYFLYHRVNRTCPYNKLAFPLQT